MVDGGRQRHEVPISQDYLVARAQNRDQWRWIVGNSFEALAPSSSDSPKFRVPANQYVFEDFSTANRIVSEHVVSIGSLAKGGLSNIWGCGVASLSDTELSVFPSSIESMRESYQRIAQRIGVSGRCNDDISDYFGLDNCAQPSLPLDDLHEQILNLYARRRTRVLETGIRIGRSRVAVLSTAVEQRLPCNQSGNCLWGCARDALYSATAEISTLQKYPNFSYESGFIVSRIDRNSRVWRLCGTQSDNTRGVFHAPRVLLGAGTLATTRLVLQTLRRTTPHRLLACPSAAFLVWVPRALGRAHQRTFALGQLSYTLSYQEAGVVGFGSTFSTTGIPVSDFARHLPLRRRYAIDILRAILSSCIVGNLFLPSTFSSLQVRLREDDSLLVMEEKGESAAVAMSHAARKLSSAFRRMGTLLLPKSFTLARSGADVHYAGTLPMARNPTRGMTNSLGEVHGAEGLHVIDGACLPVLTEKPHTLTIMANADRISREIAAQPRNHGGSR